MSTYKVFGDDISPEIKEKLKIRQDLAKGQSDAIFGPRQTKLVYHSNFEGEADLSSRTPFVRMWTAVQIERTEDPEEGPKNIGDKPPTEKPNNKVYVRKTDGVYEKNIVKYEHMIYQIGNHVFNDYESKKINTPRINQTNQRKLGQQSFFNSELEKNPFLKPAAGITSIITKTEGFPAYTRTTTINFVVHNYEDYDKI